MKKLIMRRLPQWVKCVVLASMVLTLVGCSAGGGGGGGGDEGGGGGESILIAVSSAGTLYQIDTATGLASFVANSGITGIDSMAYERSSQSLYAGTNTGTMYSVSATNYTSSTITFSGGDGDTGGSYTGMAGHPTNGRVYVMNESECSSVFSFAPPGAVPTAELSSSGVQPCYSLNSGGLPIAIDNTGTLHMVNNYSDAREVHRLNPGDDSYDVLGTFTYVDMTPVADTDFINGMVYLPSDDKVYVTLTTGDLAVMDWSNPDAITVTYVGNMGYALDGLTAVPDVTVIE